MIPFSPFKLLKSDVVLIPDKVVVMLVVVVVVVVVAANSIFSLNSFKVMWCPYL